MSLQPVIEPTTSCSSAPSPTRHRRLPSLNLKQNLEWTERETVRRALERVTRREEGRGRGDGHQPARAQLLPRQAPHRRARPMSAWVSAGVTTYVARKDRVCTAVALPPGRLDGTVLAPGTSEPQGRIPARLTLRMGRGRATFVRIGGPYGPWCSVPTEGPLERSPGRRLRASLLPERDRSVRAAGLPSRVPVGPWFFRPWAAKMRTTQPVGGAAYNYVSCVRSVREIDPLGIPRLARWSRRLRKHEVSHGPNPGRDQHHHDYLVRDQPKNIQIAIGTRVIFMNSDSRSHTMNSDPHPEHGDCPELHQVGFLNPGERRETGNLVTARNCGYHDHDNPGATTLQGTITIK